jgi:hypothetical protein
VGLYDTTVGSLLDGLRVSPLSQEKANGTENDALAGSCLTSDDRETLMEVDVELVDQSEILDI